MTASSATAGRAMCANWKISPGGSPRSIRKKPSRRRWWTPNWRSPLWWRPATIKAGDENLSGSVERYLTRYFSELRRWPAAAWPLPPHFARSRGTAAVGGPDGDPRQPDPRRRSSRRQSQHFAQENPRLGYPGLSHQRQLSLALSLHGAAAGDNGPCRERTRGPRCRVPSNCRNRATLLYKSITRGEWSVSVRPQFPLQFK